MKQKLTKINGEVDNSTIIVIEFNVIGLLKLQPEGCERV